MKNSPFTWRAFAKRTSRSGISWRCSIRSSDLLGVSEPVVFSRIIEYFCAAFLTIHVRFDLMIKENEQTTSQLVRALKLRDLVLFHIVAVLGLRHLATSAEFGPGVLMIWLVAALFFFVPQGLAVIELSSRFPNEGGIYFWTKRAFGEGHGFLCGWCYWVNNVLYYPNLLMSTAAIATYIIGKGESGLDKRWIYVLPVTLIALWIAVALNVIGANTGKWLQNAGGVGNHIDPPRPLRSGDSAGGQRDDCSQTHAGFHEHLGAQSSSHYRFRLRRNGACLGEGTEVKEVYLILLDTQLLIYFIPYIYLFIVFLLNLRHRETQADVMFTA